MGVVQAVKRAELIGWETARQFSVPIGILRQQSGGGGFDPNTLAPIPATTTLSPTSGTLTTYSSEEMRVLGDVLEIGPGSMKIILDVSGLGDVKVSDQVMLWDTLSSYKGYVVHPIAPPGNFPASSPKMFWVCISPGSMGGSLQVAQGDILHAPGGTFGGADPDEWVVYPYTAKAEILGVRTFGNLGMSLAVLDVKRL